MLVDIRELCVQCKECRLPFNLLGDHYDILIRENKPTISETCLISDGDLGICWKIDEDGKFICPLCQVNDDEIC